MKNPLKATSFRQHLVAVMAVVAMTALAAGPASAESTTITVAGGSLTSTTAAIAFSGVTLDGTDQTNTGSASWTVVDATGTGSGWNITVIATNFTGSTRTIYITESDQDLLVSVGSIAVTTGNGVPTTAVGSNTDVPFTGETALKILSAATDDGMGTFTYVPTFTLEVPAEEYAVAYTGTITVTIASAP